jgi:ParB family chromosome partitioning protein
LPQPVTSLALDAIRPNPRQPRRRFDEGALDELAASLREHGVLQPVLVRCIDGGHELIAGERRWQAARRAGLATIPALIVQASELRAQELALVENLQRAELSPVEEAEAYRGLIAGLGITQEELAQRIGISRVAVANRLRLLALAPAALEALEHGIISEGHARALLALPDDRQPRAVAAIVDGRLSVRATERLVRRWLTEKSTDRVKAAVEPSSDALAALLRDALGAQVRVRQSGGAVTVVLRFHSMAAAERLAEPWASESDE